MDKAEILAAVRSETVEEVRRRFSDQEIEDCPKSFAKFIWALRENPIEATGTEDDLAWCRLSSGRVFYSPLPHDFLRRQYRYVADTLPQTITEDGFLAALDVAQRYIADTAWPPAGLVEGTNANIIELGAYLGHKTIRFAEEMARDGGRVLAVEMLPENCEILRRNISANGFEKQIDVLPVGVWKESGTVTAYSKGRQRNSIVALDKFKDGERFEAVVRTLNDIIDDWGISPIDLVFITVNGVEIEVLEGFSPEGRAVKSLFIAAPSYVDGTRANVAACRSIVTQYGYELVDGGKPKRIVARYPG